MNSLASKTTICFLAVLATAKILRLFFFFTAWLLKRMKLVNVL